MRIYTQQDVRDIIDLKRDLKALVTSQRQAFIDFTQNLIHMPIPLQMSFAKELGDCHIKAGFKEDDDIFIVKIATGFYQNISKNLPAGDGVVLIFSQKTGLVQAILCDGGFLTTLRTALAASIAAEVTPWKIKRIGIIGTGQLASQTLTIMKLLYPHAVFGIWGRDVNKARSITEVHVNVQIHDSIKDLMSHGDIIITTTASTRPIIDVTHITGPTHIIALGADEVAKQELDSGLFDIVDAVIVDSCKQAWRFGDTYHAIQCGFITDDKVKELGSVVQNSLVPGANLIITDLTGIAAQDIAIAKFIMHKLISK